MDRPVGSAGLSRVDTVFTLAVPVSLVLLLGGILWPAFQRERMHDNIDRCRTNLAAIGKAMEVYANDYNGMLPVAGGRGTRWTGRLRDWSAGDRSQAFALDPDGSNGEATVSSSLYLLVRYMQLDPKSFVCPWERETRGFQPETFGLGNKGLGGLWDFGPEPAKHCSYAYHMVYSSYKMAIAAEPGFAIAADRNPWIDGPAGPGRVAEFSNFMPDLTAFRGTSEQALLGNASAHRKHGQNVLFLDTHVAYQRRPYCSLEDDNIYTSWDGRDKIRGQPPTLGSQPADTKDSLLVNDPPLSRK